MQDPSLNALYMEIEVYDRLKSTVLARLDEFRQALELLPIESVDVYEKCILECIRIGWDEEASKCAILLADVIKSASRFKKLAFSWKLRNRHDMCLLLLSRQLTDFFSDFPICYSLFDSNRLQRFRYTMWDQGQVYVFGDNRNRLLGVKADFIPADKPMELKLPTTLAAMGSSHYHTVFQCINGDFYGCGATRNFMVCPKSETEVVVEPVKLAIKFEPTDPVKNFYVCDTGTLIFTEKYMYLVGKKVDPKKSGKKWTWVFPEVWFIHCGKGSAMSKNLTRFTLDASFHEKYNRRAFVRSMPLNGSFVAKDNHAWIPFRGTPVKIKINERNCYYRLENESTMRIINYVVRGVETKMGMGPDTIYPNGRCVTMDPGQSVLMGQLMWAKKANCTDETDIKQYTLMVYMDECRGTFFMERFVITPDGKGYLYQVGRAEKRPFYTLKPSIRETIRMKMYHTYMEYMGQNANEIPKDLSYQHVQKLVDQIESQLLPAWFSVEITYEHRHLHMIGFIAFALTERTRLLKCHSRCSRLCWRHPLPKDAQTTRVPFRDVLTMPRIVDSDSDLIDGCYSRPEEQMTDRLRHLMNHFDDHIQRNEPIWLSPDTRSIREASELFNEMEINFYREKGLPAETTDLEPSVMERIIRRNLEFIREKLRFLSDHQNYFTEPQNRCNKRVLYNLAAVGLTWCVEHAIRGTLGWSVPRQTVVQAHFKTRNPQTIVLKRIRAGLLKPDTIPLDVNVRFHYRVKGIRAPNEETAAKMHIHTNRVLLSMLNPSLNDHIQHNVLSLNSLLETFENMWTVTLEYPMTVFFFLQHFRQSPVTVNENSVPREQLAKYGFKLVLEKHAADCPDRMFGVTWHYATLKYMHHREDVDIIAPVDLFGKGEIWDLNCRGKRLLCHKYLLLIYSKHPDLSNRDDPKKRKFDVDEDHDVVLAALRMLSDINTIERYTWEKRLAICRFFGRYLFPEALEDALAACVLMMTEADAPYIRPLISEYPAIMERHIGLLRPSVVINWPDDLLPEPKHVHMARIVEHWPGKNHGMARITKSFLDPTFSRLLRTDEKWKRQFFTDPEKDTQPDIVQLLKEDMFTKTTFSYTDRQEPDEV